MHSTALCHEIWPHLTIPLFSQNHYKCFNFSRSFLTISTMLLVVDEATTMPMLRSHCHVMHHQFKWMLNCYNNTHGAHWTFHLLFVFASAFWAYCAPSIDHELNWFLFWFLPNCNKNIFHHFFKLFSLIFLTIINDEHTENVKGLNPPETVKAANCSHIF